MADDDRASNPGTEPFVPDFSGGSDSEDTGTHSWVPDFDDTGSQPVPTAAGPQKPAQARQPAASVAASAARNPWFTSSKQCARTSAASSGMATRATRGGK